MSLTSALEDRNSTVREFFEERFPNTKKVIGEKNSQLRRVETIRPPEEVSRDALGTIGTAFDYRMRYHLVVTPSEKLVAWKGASIAAGNIAEVRETTILGRSTLTEESVENFFSDLDGLLANVKPSKIHPSLQQERLLLRYCVALALFEQIRRAGPKVIPTSPLFSIRENPSTEELLSLAEECWIDDLYALTQGMARICDATTFRNVIPNPTLSGSSYVGGADADLILDNCLLDIKCSINIKKLQLYQVLGYVLSDLHDEYAIERAGFYMARQCQPVIWDLDDLIGRLMVTPQPLELLREEISEGAFF